MHGLVIVMDTIVINIVIVMDTIVRVYLDTQESTRNVTSCHLNGYNLTSLRQFDKVVLRRRLSFILGFIILL